jgi:hypothetical protein
MEYTKEQIEAWKAKAEQWDDLEKEIGQCYEYDDDGEPLFDEDEVDLTTIGEIAATAFGYL